MKDKLYTNRRTGNMKKGLLSLAIGSLILSGCTATKNLETNKELSSTTDIVKNDFIDQMALHDAVRARDIKAVEFLIDQKTKINIKDNYGTSPLHLAVQLQEFDIAELLINNGANTNTKDNYNDTPLLDSTRDNYSLISKLLICNGANRDVVDRHKMSPLHNSSKNNNTDISKMLRAKNLDQYCGKKKENITEDLVETEQVVEAIEPIVEETTTNTQDAVSFVGLYDALNEEFKDDFDTWDAELTKDDLLFRFNNPIALFQTGKSELRVGFTDILSDFFPRYLMIVEKYKDEIKEIRIEGHTSSEYKFAKTDEDRYRLNKILSEQRAKEVRDYTVNKAAKNSDISKEWIENTFKSYGISYDNPIMNPDGTENADASRRVDFKITKISQ